MSAESLQRAYKTIKDQRVRAELIAQQHADEIAQKIPETQKWMRYLLQTGGRIAKIILSGQDNVKKAIEEIMQDNLNAQHKLTILLKENGYPDTYLDVQYSCPLCNDTGYCHGLQCKCLKQLAMQYAAADFNKQSNIVPQSFESFSLKYYSNEPINGSVNVPSKTMRDILEFCHVYTDRFEIHSPSILMMGNTGLGKTHLSLAIAKEVMKKGFSVMYTSAPDLFRRIQNEYYGKGEPGMNLMDMLLKTNLVILDDLGSEIENQFNVSMFYNIVNTRLNADKPMIISTNFSPKELESRYSARITSRLMTMYKCLKFVGKDIRQQKLKNNEL